MPDSPTIPKPKRRWLQFSLRTFLVLVTVFAVWFGWLTHKAREQRKAVAWVEKMGGGVIYDAEPPGPKWVRDILGIDFVADVSSIYLSNAQVTDVTPLAGLKNLQKLYLSHMQLSDLTPLAGLNDLEVLHLFRTQVSEEQVTKLKQALPHCKIDWSPD